MGAVKSVKSQVVAGVVFRIIFDYTTAGEQRSAEAKIFLQPWNEIAQVESFREL